MIFMIVFGLGAIVILAVVGVILFAWAKGVWVVVGKIIKGEW